MAQTKRALAKKSQMDQVIQWDGITQTLLFEFEKDKFQVWKGLANAAKNADWPRVFDLLSDHPEWVNSSRLGSPSLYTPLHQAAWHGASIEVVTRLISLGAWRTIRNSLKERAVEVAERRGHRHLLQTLAPQYKHHVPQETLLKIEAYFHAVIRGRCQRLIEKHELRLPELEPLLELEQAAMYFSVPGMAGGFSYRLVSEGNEAKLISESWCRVVGGSGQRHEIAANGSQLTGSGFV